MTFFTYIPPKFSEKIKLFRSNEQFFQYTLFMIPTFIILIILNQNLNIESFLPLYLALIGSFASLLAAVPSSLIMDTSSYTRLSPVIRTWLEEKGYVDVNGRTYVHKWRMKKYTKYLIYPENHFEIDARTDKVTINGPDWQIRKLNKLMRKRL